MTDRREIASELLVLPVGTEAITVRMTPRVIWDVFKPQSDGMLRCTKHMLEVDGESIEFYHWELFHLTNFGDEWTGRIF